MGKAKKQIDEISHKETYQNIIQTAQRLFMELGYRAVSTRQIAHLCGITQPALYHHFNNKQTLYVEVIKNTLHNTEMDLNAILFEYEAFRDRFYQMVIYFMTHFEVDMSQMFHDIYHEIGNEDQQRIHTLWKKGFLLPVIKMLDDGCADGEIREPFLLQSDSTELAYLILNMIKSILQPPSFVLLPATEQIKWAEKKAKLIVEIFLKGIGR
jgi:AcrR family transcriptional regulator